MPKLSVAIVASLLTGFAVAALMIGPPKPDKPTSSTAIVDFDENAGVEERLHALEMAVSAERQARQLLEEELLILYEEFDSLEPGAEELEHAVASEVERDIQPDIPAQIGSARQGGSKNRLSALAEAGFSVARANWIVQRESELLIESMQARYEARRAGLPQNPLGRSTTPGSMLRGEIGDAEYEMYLRAGNRPTSVNIGRVMDASPALTAGMQAGDQITHYNGVRVFSTRDLTHQTMLGNPGETIVVNIVRDGTPIQLVLPRGPLGINIGRGR